MSALLVATAIVACDSSTSPDDGLRRNLGLEVSSATVLMTPGSARKLSITIAPQPSNMRLSVSGLPSGMDATFTPGVIVRGSRASALFLSVPDDATNLSATLIIGVVPDSSPAATPPLDTASIHLTVEVLSSQCPADASPAECTPVPAVYGTVYARQATGRRPLAGATVGAWGEMSYYGYTASQTRADSNGAYRFTALPGDGVALLQALSLNYHQPCAAVVHQPVQSELLDIELVPDARPVFDTAPPPPALTGVVYELVGGTRQPVAGARVHLLSTLEIGAASTVTDSQGRYSLCRLPTGASLVMPVKGGYISDYRNVTVYGVVRMDLQLKRTNPPPSACPGYALPDDCPPFATGGTAAVSGTVFVRTSSGRTPLADAPVGTWVQRATNGYASSQVRTDATGAFSLTNLPADATLLLWAAAANHHMPCAGLVTPPIAHDTVEIELVHDARPIFDPAPPPPALTGVVYEMVGGVRQPVAGAVVFFESFFEIVAAFTISDSQGRYSLCRLPTSVSFVTPVKDGYITEYREVTVNGVVTMDLELKTQ